VLPKRRRVYPAPPPTSRNETAVGIGLALMIDEVAGRASRF
jgi:hypothetical protein